MRRLAATILLVIGGWLLASEVMVAWIDVGQTVGVRLGMLAIFCALAAPLLLLGLWASPGNRPAETGLTFLIAAGMGAAVTLTIFVLLADPSFTALMPSDRPVPMFKVARIAGPLNLLIVAGCGWLLYRLGKRRGLRQRH